MRRGLAVSHFGTVVQTMISTEDHEMPQKNTAAPVALVALAAVLVLGGLAFVLMPDEDAAERIDDAPPPVAENAATSRPGRVPASESAPAPEPEEKRTPAPRGAASPQDVPPAPTAEPAAAASATPPRPSATRAPVETPADRVARLEAELTRLTTAERKTRFHPRVRGVLKQLNEARAELGLDPVE